LKTIFYLVTSLLLMGTSCAATAITEETKAVIVNATHYEHAVWNRVPISFVVPVGEERMLIFPGKIDFRNLDARLTSDKVSILNNDGTLYIQAKQPFSAIRVPLVLKDTGRTVLVDISAAANADNTPLEVILPEDNTGGAHDSEKSPSEVLHYVTLMRYAVQHLYAPERLMVEDARISRSPMYTTRSIALFYDESVIAMPLISWHGGDYTVTAILLKNNENHAIYLDPRKIKGQWITASFYPTHQLMQAGSRQDRTTLFLMSDRPFNEALNRMKENGNE
jgi:integrating conjugative element protein (TIGR03749 family)